MENKKKEKTNTTYPTDDLYYIAAVKALFNIIHDETIIVEADLYGKQKKCIAIYKNKKMPPPSSIKMICSGKNITIRQFIETFIQVKRAMFQIIDEDNEKDEKGQKDERKQE